MSVQSLLPIFLLGCLFSILTCRTALYFLDSNFLSIICGVNIFLVSSFLFLFRSLILMDRHSYFKKTNLEKGYKISTKEFLSPDSQC